MLETLGQFAAIIATLAAIIYALGLVALWLPVRREYAVNFYAAWYAVSLVPRAVVAAQGIRTVLGFALRLALVFVVAEVMGFFLVAVVYYFSNRLLMSLILGTSIWAIVMLFYVLSSIRNRIKRLSGAYSDGNGAVVLFTAVSAFLVSIGAGVGGWVAGRGGWMTGQGVDYLPDRFWPSVDWSSVSYGLAFSGGMAILAGFFVAAANEPPLPTVRLIRVRQESVEGEQEERSVQGNLVAHTDNHWYLFEGTNSTLTAIPDTEAREVHVSS